MESTGECCDLASSAPLNDDGDDDDDDDDVDDNHHKMD